MLEFIRKFFTKNLGLKSMALILALMLWFYIVDELHRGNEEERQFLNNILPSEGVVAKKLSIKSVFVGHTHAGFAVNSDKVMIAPQYCIVVGTKELLGRINYAYTMPIDLAGASRSFVRSIALSPIAPGIYTEETLVDVTVPVEKVG